jgi:hypothetical protein
MEELQCDESSMNLDCLLFETALVFQSASAFCLLASAYKMSVPVFQFCIDVPVIEITVRPEGGITEELTHL